MLGILVKIIIISLPFMQVIGGVNISLADIFMPITIIILALKRFKLDKNIFLYSVALISSIALSSYINMIKFENINLNSLINIIKFIINIAYLNLFYIFIKSNENRLEIVLDTWKIAAIIQATLGVIGFILYKINNSSTLFMFANRARGTFEDPNLYSAYLLMSLGIIIFSNIKNDKPIICLEAIVLLIGALLSGSRSALIVIAIIILSLFIYSKGIRSKFSIILMSLFGMMLMYNSNIFESLLNRLTEVNTNSDIRFVLWGLAVKIIVNNIIFGVGIGNFTWVANQFWNANIVNLVHNTYLSIMVENGVITTVLFFGIYIYIFMNLIKQRKIFTENLGLIISILVLMVSFMSLNLENFRNAWIIVAISLVQIKNNRILHSKR